MGLLLGQVSKWRAQRADRGAHAARSFVGGAACPIASGFFSPQVVSMPHAALWVVQHLPRWKKWHQQEVSMPHAALWVVQRASARTLTLHGGFNAARGFVGGATG